MIRTHPLFFAATILMGSSAFAQQKTPDTSAIPEQDLMPIEIRAIRAGSNSPS